MEILNTLNEALQFFSLKVICCNSQILLISIITYNDDLVCCNSISKYMPCRYIRVKKFIKCIVNKQIQHTIFLNTWDLRTILKINTPSRLMKESLNLYKKMNKRKGAMSLVGGLNQPTRASWKRFRSQNNKIQNKTAKTSYSLFIRSICSPYTIWTEIRPTNL